MLIKRIALLLVVSVGASATGLVLLLAGAFVVRAWWTTPFEVLGFGAAPEQPIAFPHTIHAGVDVWTHPDGSPKLDADGNELSGLGLDCTFCHRNVDKGATAGVPPVEQCLFCHASVQGDELEEVAKLVEAWDTKEPVAWERVHRVPDHVRFVHEAHIRYFLAQGVTPDGSPALVAADVCSTCHGDVAAMAEVNQVRSLKMGDCVDCHRDYNAPTDCTTCHY